jgi:tetratricopeptide (TPR) repeat protein
VDRLTRHQLKQDEFRDSIEQMEGFFKEHAKEILNGTIIVVVVVGLMVGVKYYTGRQEAQANADLGAALQTFRAYVGPAAPGEMGPDAVSFATAADKYKKALDQFRAITEKYKMIPRPKAVDVARYQLGVCQSLLDDHAAAVQTLLDVSKTSNKEIAALAKFALAGELAKAGKPQDAAKLYQELADHPTLAVPKASALLAMADVYRVSQPAQALQIYERVEKEFPPNSPVTQVVKQQLATLAQ